MLFSVTPSSGSIYGGTDITLNGENFALNLIDNNVFIYLGDVNLMCNVLKATDR